MFYNKTFIATFTICTFSRFSKLNMINITIMPDENENFIQNLMTIAKKWNNLLSRQTLSILFYLSIIRGLQQCKELYSVHISIYKKSFFKVRVA